MDSNITTFSLNSIQIQSLLGMTYPMLLIDRVTELLPGEYCRAYKNLTYNEWFFPAHYPSNPIMPGMLQIEALTQALAITVLSTEKRTENKLFSVAPTLILLTGVDKCRFYHTVVPGNVFSIYAEIESLRLGYVIGSAYGKVDDGIVCECKYSAKLIND